MGKTWWNSSFWYFWGFATDRWRFDWVLLVKQQTVYDNEACSFEGQEPVWRNSLKPKHFWRNYWVILRYSCLGCGVQHFAMCIWPHVEMSQGPRPAKPSNCPSMPKRLAVINLKPPMFLAIEASNLFDLCFWVPKPAKVSSIKATRKTLGSESERNHSWLLPGAINIIGLMGTLSLATRFFALVTRMGGKRLDADEIYE